MGPTIILESLLLHHHHNIDPRHHRVFIDGPVLKITANTLLDNHSNNRKMHILSCKMIRAVLNHTNLPQPTVHGWGVSLLVQQVRPGFTMERPQQPVVRTLSVIQPTARPPCPLATEGCDQAVAAWVVWVDYETSRRPA